MQMTTAALDRYLSGNQMRLDPKKMGDWSGWLDDRFIAPSFVHHRRCGGGSGREKRGCVNPRLLASGSCSVKE